MTNLFYLICTVILSILVFMGSIYKLKPGKRYRFKDFFTTRKASVLVGGYFLLLFVSVMLALAATCFISLATTQSIGELEWNVIEISTAYAVTSLIMLASFAEIFKSRKLVKSMLEKA